MKRYWMVLMEQYQDGTVKAAVLKDKLAEARPRESYRMEWRREIFTEWFDTYEEAQQAVDEAKALNAGLLAAARAA